ncbi:ester cyclase [Paraburkholderia sp. C35]|uniref:ester cyclase n=1 Tax=Paraburkholderia sp. C35 TaxID=2126993 RepID=UPI000D68F520|nr:ester cyclase [Paraburkholderia sp. C35]
MSSLDPSRVCRSAIALLVSDSSAFAPAFAAGEALVQPHALVVDASLPKAIVDAEVLAARRYDTFWSTGDEAPVHAALAPGFTDRTLPPGRSQGIAGPLAASKFVRGAVPDMHCDIEHMIVSRDRVIAHLRFTGHFTGHFNNVQGQGQPIDFIATDIYRVEKGRIADNWHLEDNLTFLQQLGVVAR